MYSNLDLVNLCDNFPYPDTDPDGHAQLMKTLYHLVWEENGITTNIGLVTEPVFNAFARVPTSIKGELEANRSSRSLSIFQQTKEAERSQRAAATAAYWRERKTFSILSGWRDELYPVYGPRNELLYNVERTASALLGVTTYGVHLVAFVASPTSSHGIKLYIPRRAAGKQTYANMLDNTVAGGLASGENPLECLVREAEEEASLPSDFVRENAKSHGTITYVYLRGESATGEVGLVQPECQYVYDLELPPHIVPRPNDDEVQEFYLWTVEETQQHMANGEFKPNCALVTLDFFIRRGILTPENEDNYDEIKRRLHRVLDFPGPHRHFE